MMVFAATGMCTANAPASSGAGLTECLGYYTVGLPGRFEYALLPGSVLVSTPKYVQPQWTFENGLGAWGSDIRLGLSGRDTKALFISPRSDAIDLEQLTKSRNEKQTRDRENLLREANLFTPPNLTRDDLLKEADEIPTFRSMGGGRVVAALFGTDNLALHVLVNGHILSTELKLQGTPEQTLDAFFSHYKSRALGEVPSGPGVCVPFGTFSGERQPATVGLNIRLKDQPDIVVFLLARDAATDEPEDPENFIDRKTQPMTTFYGSRGATAMNRFRPGRHVTIDGQKGLGVFVNIERDATLLQSVHNPATGNIDWGYLAYIPGLSGGKPGDSFNLTFKVERFGRFATRPMSESEFRELTLRIAASIKRRPGAWVRN